MFSSSSYRVHPRRPRGSQSGREKRRHESKGGRAPGYRLSPNYFQKFKRMPAPDWAQKCFVLLCPIGEEFLLFVSSYTTAIPSLCVQGKLLFSTFLLPMSRKNVWDAIRRSNSICPENFLFLTDHNVS